MRDASSPALSTRDELSRESRYELLSRIASGGMATVYVGRLRGAEGFWRLVAIKRAHPHLLEDPDFRRILAREARLASRIHHPNVVSVQDVEERDGELLLVMDFIEGAALSSLLAAAVKNEKPMPPRVAIRIALDAAHGLHAAHELTGDDGALVGLVHRDVSPQNILVGQDGAARIADFGIAKGAVENFTSARTTTGVLKGKLAYMAPEYVDRGDMDLRGDVFALGVVLWEALANQRLFRAPNELEVLRRVTTMEAPLISHAAPWVGDAVDGVLAKVLEKSPERRFQTARAFAEALDAAASRAGLIASTSEVGDHVRSIAAPEMAQRRALLRERVGGSGVDVISAPVSATIDANGASVVTSTLPDRPQSSEALAAPEPEPEPIETATAAIVREIPTLRGLSGPPPPPPLAEVSLTRRAFPVDPNGERVSGSADTVLDVYGVPPPSTLTEGGIASPFEAADPLTDERWLQSRRRVRLGASLVLSALALATAGVVGSRWVASSSAGGVTASTTRPATAAALAVPRGSSGVDPAPARTTADASASGPTPAPSHAASASIGSPSPSPSVQAADPRTKPGAGRPAGRASATAVTPPSPVPPPVREPDRDKAPPNPYGTP